jgi:hypothetical protein
MHHRTCQSSDADTTKKDKIKTVPALMNELQVQDSAGLDDELNSSKLSKSAMVGKLAHVTPEIWMTLAVEAKKWLLKERKHHQQEEDSKKRSSCLGFKNTTKILIERKIIPIYQTILYDKNCCERGGRTPG